MTPPSRLASVLFLGSITATGCDLTGALDDLQSSSTLVNVSVTHHGTPTDAGFPDHGGDGEVREFITDEGWAILLSRAYVVTSQVSLQRCDATDMAVESYRGAIAEDITATDLEPHIVGGIDVERTSLCGLHVTYAPYTTGNDASVAGPEDIHGATIFFAGAATKGDVRVPFTVRSTETIGVDLDVSRLDEGGPVVLSGQEDFPVEFDVSKTYDRFFDGVDFASFAGATEVDLALTQQVEALLAIETRVGLGGVSVLP